MKKEWELFDFDDVFTRQRGRRLIEADQIPGDIAYISSSKQNNGLSAFISPPDFMVRYQNKITIANSGSVGSCFFHDYEFVASDHVTVIGIKNKQVELNSNIALFLKPIFESIKYKYNFGREISDSRLSKERILLPIKCKGVPDWEYMEQRSNELRKSITFQKANSTITLTSIFSMHGWQEFKIIDLFPNMESCKCSKAGDLIDGNDVYYLGAKKRDACVIKKVSVVPELLTKGNCIAFICDGDGSVGYSNYIPFDQFIGTTNLTVGYNEHINKYTGAFLVAVLDLQRSKYSFGRKYKRNLNNTKILLPAKNGEPDWAYMENYIKSLPYSDRI